MVTPKEVTLEVEGARVGEPEGERDDDGDDDDNKEEEEWRRLGACCDAPCVSLGDVVRLRVMTAMGDRRNEQRPEDSGRLVGH